MWQLKKFATHHEMQIWIANNSHAVQYSEIPSSRLPQKVEAGMTTFVQRRDPCQLETVDEFETYKEALAMVREYQMSDPSAHYYLSSRACKDWRESRKENP